MADDIDDLLDEMEDKYIKKGSKSQVVGSSTRKETSYSTSTNGRGDTVASMPTTKHKTSSKTSDLDALLKEMDVSDMKKPIRPSEASSHSKHTDAGKLRCHPIVVAPTSLELGHGSTVTPRACDRLRCTACDFRISIFENSTWSGSTDYLFLRNNMPDFDRLKSKLSNKRGCRAYACQCKHLNVTAETDLVQLRDYKWVCGKH